MNQNPVPPDGPLWILTDMDLCILGHSSAALALAGAGQIRGKNISEVFPATAFDPVIDRNPVSISDAWDTSTGSISWNPLLIKDEAGRPGAIRWSGIRNESGASSFQHLQQAILEHMSEAWISFDAGWNLTGCNRTAADQLGIPFMGGVPQETLQCITVLPGSVASIAQTLGQHGLCDGRLLLQQPGGAITFFRGRVVAVTHSGQVSGYVALGQEMGPAVNPKTHAESGTSLADAFMEQTDALAFAIDEQGLFRYWNTAFAKIWGLEKANRHPHLSDFFTPDHAEKLQQQNLQVIRENKVLNIIQELNTPSGPCSYKTFKFPVHMPDRTLVAGLAMDITTELRREEELARMEQRYKVAANLTADIIADWDIPNDRLWRNDPEHHVMVHQVKATSMANRYERVHPEDVEGFRQSLQAALQSKAAYWDYEYRYASGQVAGEYKVLLEKASILRNAAGQACQMISVVQDVTENRRLQKEIRQKEKDVMAATIEGQEAERREIACELHDNVGQLLAVCKLFIDMSTDLAQHPNIQLCRENLLLAIAEIRSISHRLSPVCFDVNGFVSVIGQLVNNINQAGLLQLHLEVDPAVLAQQLSQQVQTTAYRIVQEGVSNILKHSKATCASIRIWMETGVLCFSVTDNGKGFDAADRTNGIGLKNIYNRAKVADGRVDIEAAPGKGCTLKVQLPIAVG